MKLDEVGLDGFQFGLICGRRSVQIADPTTVILKVMEKAEVGLYWAVRRRAKLPGRRQFRSKLHVEHFASAFGARVRSIEQRISRNKRFHKFHWQVVVCLLQYAAQRECRI